MDALVYVNNLQSMMIPCALMGPNARQRLKTPSRLPKQWFISNKIHAMNWPAHSSDLNLIENLLVDVKQAFKDYLTIQYFKNTNTPHSEAETFRSRAKGAKAVKKPLVKQQSKEKRLEWAIQQKECTLQQWYKNFFDVTRGRWQATGDLITPIPKSVANGTSMG
ncbi:GLI2 [Trypoxylus dichotomus]